MTVARSFEIYRFFHGFCFLLLLLLLLLLLVLRSTTEWNRKKMMAQDNERATNFSIHRHVDIYFSSVTIVAYEKGITVEFHFTLVCWTSDIARCRYQVSDSPQRQPQWQHGTETKRWFHYVLACQKRVSQTRYFVMVFWMFFSLCDNTNYENQVCALWLLLLLLFYLILFRSLFGPLRAGRLWFGGKKNPICHFVLNLTMSFHLTCPQIALNGRNISLIQRDRWTTNIFVNDGE